MGTTIRRLTEQPTTLPPHRHMEHILAAHERPCPSRHNNERNASYTHNEPGTDVRPRCHTSFRRSPHIQAGTRPQHLRKTNGKHLLTSSPRALPIVCVLINKQTYTLCICFLLCPQSSLPPGEVPKQHTYSRRPRAEDGTPTVGSS